MDYSLITPQDKNHVLRLLGEVFNHQPDSTALGYANRSIDKAISDPNADYAWYIGKLDNKVISTLMVQRHTVIFGVHSLMWLAVHQDFRRKGYAKSLIEFSGHQEAKQNTEEKEAVLVLGTENKNHNFYLKLQFAPMGPLQTGHSAFSRIFKA